MMILLTYVLMMALLIVTAMLWNEYYKDIRMARYRKEIELIDFANYENKLKYVCEPEDINIHCA